MARRAHSVIPRRGSADWHVDHLRSLTPDPLGILLLSRGDDRYRRSNWVTRGQRQEPSPPPITRAGSIRLPCRPVTSRGYQQGEPVSLPCLAGALRVARLSYLIGYLTANAQGPSPPLTGSIRLSRRPDTIPCAGTVGSPDSLPF